jgi:ribose 5-phosphate isomerase B
VKIAIGSDHRGVNFKSCVAGFLIGMGISFTDFGPYTSESIDYPDIAQAVAETVARGEFNYGILICGTGIGMSIAANKINGIRAALCTDSFSAERSRAHNNANILCLGAERGEAGVKEMLEVFFNTRFEGGRHQRRLDKIAQIENRQC